MKSLSCDPTRRGEACCSAFGSDDAFVGNQTSLPCRLCCRKSWRGGKIRRCCIAKLLEITWHVAWAHYSTYALPLFEAAATEWLIKELGCNVSFASNVQVRHSSVRCAVWCAASSATAIEIYGMNIFEMNLIASYWVMNHVLIILVISTQVAVSLSPSLLYFLYLLRSIWSTCIWAPAASLNFLGSKIPKLQRTEA